jgi:hypothetical protein
MGIAGSAKLAALLPRNINGLTDPAYRNKAEIESIS